MGKESVYWHGVIQPCGWRKKSHVHNYKLCVLDDANRILYENGRILLSALSFLNIYKHYSSYNLIFHYVQALPKVKTHFKVISLLIKNKDLS